MDQELFKLVGELMKQGGTTAVWLIIGIQVLKTINSCIGWVFWLWMVKIFTGIATNILKFCIEKDARELEKCIK